MKIENVNSLIKSFSKRFGSVELIPGTPEMNARNSQLEVIDKMINEIEFETGKRYIITENGLIEK